MPPKLPGLYYDAEKNRYFPIKGPIPGSSSSSSKSPSKPASVPLHKPDVCKRTELGASKLLCLRELNGNIIPHSGRKSSVTEEFHKLQASHPVVWKYRNTDGIADATLEEIQVNAQTREGETRTNVLLTGSLNGTLSLLEVGKVGKLFDHGTKFVPDRVWPTKENKMDGSKAPGRLWRPPDISVQMPSRISCLKLPRRSSTADDHSNAKRVLLTTMGAEGYGSLFLLNISEALDFSQSIPIIRQSIDGIASFNCTVWTADWRLGASDAIIGTNLGAASVDLETGVVSWILRCKSDVLAVELDQSGHVALCGLRNGAIVPVDIRERPGRLPPKLIRNPALCQTYQSSSKRGQTSHRVWFETRGNVTPSQVICMPSSISCLARLQQYDQYFMASSMDGSIKLYDLRMAKRRAIQSYEGHVNSHTSMQLGIDPSERFVISGGEDCYLRVWSIKSGKLLSANKFSDTVPSVVCWRPPERFAVRSCCQDSGSFGAWLGSSSGVFHLH